MADSDRIIESELNGNQAVARVATYELIDDFTVRRFRAGLDQVVGLGVESIELDMSQVRMLSSMAICAVITVDRQLKERGGRLRLREVHPGSLEVFSHMRLHELLDIEPQEQPELAA